MFFISRLSNNRVIFKIKIRKKQIKNNNKKPKKIEYLNFSDILGQKSRIELKN